MNTQNKPMSLHMTVATTAENNGNVDLTSEVRLLKTALMYADQVNFVSLASSVLVQSLNPISTIPNDDLFAALISQFSNDLKPAYDMYLQLQEKSRKSKQELASFEGLEDLFGKAKIHLYEEIENMAAEHGLDQLIGPYQSGILDFTPFDVSVGNFPYNIGPQYLEQVSQAIFSGETFLMVDKLTGELVDSAIQLGQLQPSSVSLSNSKHVALATELLRRLPRLEDASVDEILDIRKELEKPLIRFRSAIVKFSREIESAGWDSDFPFEANQVFIEHVQPAIQEIEERCRSNSFRKQLLPSLLEQPFQPASVPALGVILANYTEIPAIMSTGMGLVGGSAIVANKAYQSYKAEKRAIKNNNLYFYYQAGEILSRK